jgi:hypothetical protein
MTLMRSTLGMLLLAVLLFVPLFATRGAGAFDFWWWISANLLVLLALVQIVDGPWCRELVADVREQFGRKVVLGLLSAAALYVVFWVGNQFCRALFVRAGSDISAVYAFKEQAPTLRILLLMVFIIGPGEELFWRGFLQRRLQAELSGPLGFLAATGVYASVHVASGNPILVLAAGVCGFFWGWLYLRYRSMLLNVISHTAWDVAVFLLFPLGGT